MVLRLLIWVHVHRGCRALGRTGIPDDRPSVTRENTQRTQCAGSRGRPSLSSSSSPDPAKNPQKRTCDGNALQTTCCPLGQDVREDLQASVTRLATLSRLFTGGNIEAHAAVSVRECDAGELHQDDLHGEARCVRVFVSMHNIAHACTRAHTNTHHTHIQTHTPQQTWGWSEPTMQIWKCNFSNSCESLRMNAGSLSLSLSLSLALSLSRSLTLTHSLSLSLSLSLSCSLARSLSLSRFSALSLSLSHPHTCVYTCMHAEHEGYR